MDPRSPSSSLSNATAYLPSAADLLLVVPRLLSRAGLSTERMDSALGILRSGASAIAEPTAANATNATLATTAGLFSQKSAAAAASAALGAQDGASMFQGLRNIWALLNYLTSKWAIGTVAMAMLLNRTHFYASSRVPLSFDRLYVRVALYILPALLFLYRIQSLLQAMRCQTAPDWSEMQYGAPGRQLDTDFAGEGGFIWKASSALLFWEPLEASCRAVNMLPTDANALRPSGSLSLLWPLFMSLGFSQFIETLSCALQGRRPLQEVGMTLFEHSLAFVEAETMVTRPLRLDSARFWKPKSVFTPGGTSIVASRARLSQFANVPPEILLTSLISSFSHLTSNILAILGVRARYRLVTTAIWGIAYMSAFAWSTFHLINLASDSEPGFQVGMLRFPTVCMVGFIPHLLILVGIAACGIIYLIALILTVMSPPPGQANNLTWKERFSVAYGNLHANIHLSATTPLAINWNTDFYTAILKVGFAMLTAASEAVYLNEGKRINVNNMTWLEKKRLQEFLARRRRLQRSLATIPAELHGDSMGEGIDVIDGVGNDSSSGNSESGYARERKTRAAAGAAGAPRPVVHGGGVGLEQRRGRWHLTWQFLRGILQLLLAVQARMTIAVLRKLRFTYSPQWLRRLAGIHRKEKKQTRSSASTSGRPLPLMTIRLRSRQNLDVETFAREHMLNSPSFTEQGTEQSEEHLDGYLYGWWKKGGEWGDIDTSGDYIPPQDDDTTSVVSQSTTNVGDEWSDESDGQRTPTQQSMSLSTYSRESTPLPEPTIDLARLSHLLDPRTQEDREEARFLSRHLQSPGIMTRSQFRKAVERDEAKLLASSRLPIKFSEDGRTTTEDEEAILEEFILDRRGAANQTHGTSKAGTWNDGAEGMGSEGPQCVVCQLSPRSVLVWPCGCLSLCDECRVGLAAKNYTTCVCCRTNVVAYSRLYVP